jgi:DNA-binding YbaB/EbfC family protein
MNPNDLLTSLMNKLPKNLEKAQEEIRSQSFTGSAGGDWVKLTLDGEGTLKSLEIDPACVDSDDVALLSDLIKSAHQSAHTKQQEWLKTRSLEFLRS